MVLPHNRTYVLHYIIFNGYCQVQFKGNNWINLVLFDFLTEIAVANLAIQLVLVLVYSPTKSGKLPTKLAKN